MITHLSISFVVLVLVLCCAASNAAVLPLAKPGMAVKVEGGDYVAWGHKVHVAKTVELAVEPAEKVSVSAEEVAIGNDALGSWAGGTSLRKTLGPVDVGTRMPLAIDPGSVRVHSTPDGGTLYQEGKDYELEHSWGSIRRVAAGGIPDGAKVYVDYAVYLERVDSVLVKGDGSVYVKKGASAPVNVEMPTVDPRTIRLANLSVPYRCEAITASEILPAPDKKLAWRDFIKVSGREHLTNTLAMLKDGKPVTVVCWGDSVTSGGSASSPSKNYVGRFTTALKAAYPQAKINLINAGIGGSNTESRRAGYEKEVLSLNPDLITVEFVNDAGMSAEQITRNWAEFIAKAREKNPKVEFILQTPAYIFPEWMNNFPVALGAMRKAAETEHVALSDTSNIWENLRLVGIPYMTLNANGINHPNDLGHEFFCESMMELLRER